MIRSMQRRLAVVVLLFLVAVYACLCAVSYGAAVSGMVRESEQMLRSLAEPDPPMGGRIFPGQVGVPYFTLLVDGRGVLEDADQGQFDISDEELLDLAAQVLTAEEDFGYLGSYQLRYYRVSIPGGWRLVFADDSLQGELRLRQVRNSLLLGLALLPVFLAFSWLLAGLIVRPVRRAWEQQAQFVADASHELKTPLTVILSNTEMILADCPQEDPALQRRAGYIRREADRMRGLVLDMLELARSRTARSLESFPDENHASLLEDTFQEIRLAILSSCEKPWTIRQMSQMAGMEKSQFYRYYQQFFHISPGNDLIQARIQRAKYLLTNQAAQIQQIAAECGFSEATHFSRQFKRCTGMSPRQYAAGYSGPSLADTPFARKNPASAGTAAPSFRHPAAPPSECPPVPASRKNPSGSLSTSPKPASQKPSDR